jgi:hypothetical protein
MRHAAFWVASVGLFMGAVFLYLTYVFSPDHAELYRAATTDFAVALIELGITVGVVDLLLKSYAERQRVQSIVPRAQELTNAFTKLQSVEKRYLTGLSVADIELYRRVAADVQQSTFGLYILLLVSNTIFASDLLRLSQQMREHVEVVEDAISSIKNGSLDASGRVGQVRKTSKELFEAGTVLAERLAREYHS